MSFETINDSTIFPEGRCILCGKPTYISYEFEPKAPKKYGFTTPTYRGERQVIFIALCEKHPFNRRTREEILKRLGASMN